MVASNKNQKRYDNETNVDVADLCESCGITIPETSNNNQTQRCDCRDFQEKTILLIDREK